GPSKLRECPAAGLRDAEADDLDRAPTGDHALGLRYREPGGDQLDQHVDREPVGEHDGLSAAVAIMFEQFERATAGGGRSMLAARRRHRWRHTPRRSPRGHVGITQDVSLTLQILQAVLDYITDADDTGELTVAKHRH